MVLGDPLQEELGMERFFELQRHGATVRIEILAGLTTFLTAAYIIFVNPSILSETGYSTCKVGDLDGNPFAR